MLPQKARILFIKKLIGSTYKEKVILSHKKIITKPEKFLKAITHGEFLRKQPREKPRQVTTVTSYGKSSQF